MAFAPSAWCRPVSAPTPACRPCWSITEKRYCCRRISTSASGCRLDLARLQNAGARVAEALGAGADLLIVNCFGKRERDGKGLAYLIERALDADIPIVIAVSSNTNFLLDVLTELDNERAEKQGLRDVSHEI